jgi:hypothetical protein
MGSGLPRNAADNRAPEQNMGHARREPTPCTPCDPTPWFGAKPRFQAKAARLLGKTQRQIAYRAQAMRIRVKQF